MVLRLLRWLLLADALVRRGKPWSHRPVPNGPQGFASLFSGRLGSTSDYVRRLPAQPLIFLGGARTSIYHNGHGILTGLTPCHKAAHCEFTTLRDGYCQRDNQNGSMVPSIGHRSYSFYHPPEWRSRDRNPPDHWSHQRGRARLLWRGKVGVYDTRCSLLNLPLGPLLPG